MDGYCIILSFLKLGPNFDFVHANPEGLEEFSPTLAPGSTGSRDVADYQMLNVPEFSLGEIGSRRLCQGGVHGSSLYGQTVCWHN